MNYFFLFLFLLFIGISGVTVGDESNSNREKKLFNIFQVVRFPNDPCIASSSRNGTCYTEAECENRSGISGGSCASGFGVCCIFNRGCGGTSSENCTFFEVADGSVNSGQCTMTVCPCSSNICSLRLDFNTFTIAGPSTSTTEVVRLLNGAAARLPAANAIPASVGTQCLTDTFSVTNPGGATPPLICGSNSGDHMYVDASNECNLLDFNIGSSTTTTRQWSIKVTQISCNDELLPPQGCTQYYYGNTVNTAQSYNWDGNLHLANQNQLICVRQERGNCRICWSATASADFALSGKDTSVMGHDGQENCCRYGVNGINTNGYDCLIIQGAENAAGGHEPSRICGRGEGLINTGGAATTLCSTTTPFQIRFNSDNWEFTGAIREAQATHVDIGFRVAFIQDNTNCFSTQ